MMQDLNDLRAFSPDKYDLDELVALKAFGDNLSRAYADAGMENPEWLNEAREGLNKEIAGRSRDMLEKELRETESRIEALKTADEKRTDLRGKAERLKAKLAAKSA